MKAVQNLSFIRDITKELIPRQMFLLLETKLTM